MAKNERTLKMIEEYIALFDSGLTAVEIAEKFGLHYTTVYQNLDVIAQAAGRSRESLLHHPHKQHESYDHAIYKGQKKLEIEGIHKNFQEIELWMEKILKEVTEE